MSLASLLSIARTALLAQQRAMEISGHNVANAQTPGYSRQRVRLVAATPVQMPDGAVGRGVSILGVERMRDAFLDAGFRRESSLLGRSSTRADVLDRVVGALNEPTDTGLASALDGLFQSFSDLATDPTAPASRTLVRQAAQRFVEALHHLDGEIRQTASDSLDQMRTQVTEVNDLTSRIAALNSRITAARNQGGAPDLEDQRDLLVDQLSTRLDVQVLHRDNGSVSVIAGDTLLVDAGQSHALEVRTPGGGGFQLGVVGGAAVTPQGGSLHALLELTNVTLPNLTRRLDGLATAMVTEVNNLHRSGFTIAGASGIDFFDPAGVTAGTIQLSAAVQASPDAIAASASGAAGDNGVAIQIAQLGRNGVASLGGRSFRDEYTDFASGLGVDAHNAAQDQQTDQSLLDQADSRRTAVSGVSVDEEMTLLIAQQQAYGAAARLITVAEKMLDDLMATLVP